MIKGKPNYFFLTQPCLISICKCVALKIYKVEYDCKVAETFNASIPDNLVRPNKYYEAPSLKCEMRKKSNDDQQGKKINDVKTEEDSNQNEVFVIVHGLRKYFWERDSTYDMYVAHFQKNELTKVVLDGVLKKFNLSEVCKET